ncbi:hypothetical protein NDU88_007025 [Pleurodeles waltl]|uniref:Uncharacterized protein n=1 Tax=Pleurodeles waltl TaxID=8319 RepID=A0AAV7SRI3_PLEWA|nr:hypothetical protein NDU88_007025 [Pleurodeles waltl]
MSFATVYKKLEDSDLNKVQPQTTVLHNVTVIQATCHAQNSHSAQESTTGRLVTTTPSVQWGEPEVLGSKPGSRLRGWECYFIWMVPEGGTEQEEGTFPFLAHIVNADPYAIQMRTAVVR